MQWFVTHWLGILIGVAFFAMLMFSLGGRGKKAVSRGDLLRPDLDLDAPEDLTKR